MGDAKRAPGRRISIHAAGLINMNPKTGHTILEEEFEHEPVLAVRRQSTASVAAVWFAAPLYVALGILALVFDRR